MDASLAAELERVKSLLDRAVWPLSITGIWPKNVTTYTRRKSSFILTYFMFHLFLELLDLVSVCGNVELMVLNLVETGFLTMAMYRLLIIRFHKTLPKLIDSREKYMVVENFNNSEELKIYLGHASVVEKFYRWWNVYATGTAFMYYIMPLPTYLVKRMVNDETAILINPYRIYHFINVSSIPRTAFLYVYQFPIILMVASYFTSAVISLAFVTNFCGQIAVLARRIMTMTDDNTDPRHIFHRHTKQHIKILITTQWFNNTFHLPLLYDIVVTTVLMGLIVYRFMTNLDSADAVGCFGFATYIFSMMVVVYVNCFMGEYLKTELIGFLVLKCNALLNAYYECNWCDMSMGYKKALIICMQTTQEPIRITAGRFYIFSLETFTKTMKSSMVYVQMLRKTM